MRKAIVSLLILIVCGLGAYAYFAQGTDVQLRGEPSVLAARAPEIPALEALIIQVNESSGDRRVISCGSRGCAIKKQPASVETDALSDGKVWYRYRNRQDDARTIRVLEKVDLSGAASIITEESSLVRPRGIFLSTDGTKIAYFLDNIHDASGLTELWVYDSATGGTQVVAENLRKADIASRVRWNASSRAIWFLTEQDRKELVVIPLPGITAVPKPLRVAWSKSADVADQGVMDINDNASLMAFAHTSFPGFSQILVTGLEQYATQVQKTIKGEVVFIRWMKDGALLYAVQNGDNLTFWMADSSKEWPIARMKAIFRSAHSTGSLDLAAFIADPRKGESHLYVLQIATGLVKDQIVLPNMAGATSYLVQTNETDIAIQQAVAGSTSVFPDAIIAAFIQSHIGEITGNPKTIAVRIIITDSPNTVYVDYRTKDDSTKRVLVTVQDVTYPTWKVISSSDPKSMKMYEWEEALSQWILKTVY